MLPSLPIVDQVVDAGRMTQGNMVGSALHLMLVVYIACILKDMLKL